MIEVRGISKSYGEIQAVNNVTLNIREKEVFGLVGTNGAGKSTLLRLIADTLVPDEGEVTVDGRPVHDDPVVKKRMFFIADDAYYFPNTTPREMAKYYSKIYDNFDMDRFTFLINHFHLNQGRKIDTYSKGMKKQLSIILGICANTKYLLCDETFDGLDPVMRQGVKSLFAKEMEDRGLTPVIASHNLRELEDICDHIGLLHDGGVLLSEDLEHLREHVQKIQVVFKNDEQQAEFEKVVGEPVATSLEAEEASLWEKYQEEKKEELSLRFHTSIGRVHTYMLNGSREQVAELLDGIGPVYYEILNLSLEEIFISETEVAGYDIKKFILN